MASEPLIDVRLSNDKMEAHLVIPAGCQIELATAAACLATAQEQGISLSAETKKIITAATEKFAMQPEVACNVIIATGTAAVHGDNGYLQWIDGFNPDAPQADPDQNAAQDDTISSGDGKIDYYNTSHFVTADVGDHIATIYKPTEGTDGLTADGSVIPAVEGKVIKYRVDETVSVHSDGKIIANNAGLISYIDRYLRIKNTLEILESVDFSTGNINFDGSVTIHKGVCDCFKVACEEDLIVHGLVEAAEIIVKGNAELFKGMSGREKGLVIIHGNLHARYLDGTSGTIDGDLRIDKELINCDLIVGRAANLTGAAVIGGKLTAAKGLVVDVLGSEACVPTAVIVGMVPALAEVNTELRELHPAFHKILEKSKEEFDMLMACGGKLSPSQRERITECQFELSELQRREVMLDTKQEEIDTLLKSSTEPSITINKILHAGVTVILRSRQITFDSSIKGPVTLCLDERNQAVIIDGITKSQTMLETCAVQAMPTTRSKDAA